MDDDDESRQSYHMRCASVTTVANDDFEFHTTTTGLPMPYATPVPYSQATYVMHKGPSVATTPALPQPPSHQNNKINSNNHVHQPRPYLANNQQPSTSAAALAAFNYPSSQRSVSSNQFTLDTNFSTGKVSKGSTVAVRSGRERQLVAPGICPPPPGPPASQQLTSLSMNDLDLIEELPPMSTAELRSSRPTTSAEEYKQPRLYRKRPRFQNPQSSNAGGGGARRRLQDSSALMFSMPNRRVLSLECLSPPNNQTDSPFFDVSYLDTGDVCLVKQGDGSRCIFVTDFL